MNKKFLLFVASFTTILLITAGTIYVSWVYLGGFPLGPRMIMFACAIALWKAYTSCYSGWFVSVSDIKRYLRWMQLFYKDQPFFAVLFVMIGAISWWLWSHALAGYPSSTDGTGYYSYIQALFAGRPFDLKELQAAMQNQAYPNGVSPITGRFINLWGCGTAIIWLPAVALSKLFGESSGLAAIRNMTSMMALLGVVFLYLSFNRQGIKPWIAGVCAAASLFCTPVLYYANKAQFMSHVPGYFLTCLLIWMMAKHSKVWKMGLVVGLMACVRPQSGLIGLIPLVVMIASKAKFRHLVQYALGILAGFFPQMLFWKMTAGSWICNPQEIVYNNFFQKPHLLELAFSGNHGLISWHPIVAIMLLGCLMLCFSRSIGDRVWGISIISVFAAQFYINACAGDWWAGCSFGARRFCDIIPFISLGLVMLIYQSKLTKAITALVAVLAIWNVIMWGHIGHGSILTLDRAQHALISVVKLPSLW